MFFATLITGSLTAQDEGFEFASSEESGNTAKTTQNLDIQSDFTDYDQNLGIAKAHGDVVVKYGDVTIYAIRDNSINPPAIFFGADNVKIYKDGQSYRSRRDHLQYQIRRIDDQFAKKLS